MHSQGAVNVKLSLYRMQEPGQDVVNEGLEIRIAEKSQPRLALHPP